MIWDVSLSDEEARLSGLVDQRLAELAGNAATGYTGPKSLDLASHSATEEVKSDDDDPLRRRWAAPSTRRVGSSTASDT